jgi:hypothetical protein
LRVKIVHAGSWFRGFQNRDGAFIDLTIKVVDNKVRSSALAKNIFSIEGKLEELLEDNVMRSVWEIYFAVARKLSRFARGWGNVSTKTERLAWVSLGFGGNES